jgi:hypothetical protein
MRGEDRQQSSMFSYLSPEQRVRQDHPLRAIRTMADVARFLLFASSPENPTSAGCRGSGWYALGSGLQDDVSFHPSLSAVRLVINCTQERARSAHPHRSTL